MALLLTRSAQERLWPLKIRPRPSQFVLMLESADHALFKLVRYVLLRPLRPELDVIKKTTESEKGNLRVWLL
jgi:hypothetical protein